MITVLKDVIENSGGSIVQKFVEQSTIIHEMDHALGLVNNGVPMNQPHQDVENGAHATNDECVMYWLHEGASDLAQFIQKFISTNSPIMWGQEVLADVEAFSQ